MSLAGWRFGVAVAADFVLGALMCIGIGNYAPTMVLLGVLGMHRIAAYPIMIGSDGVLIPVASLGFFKSGRFAHDPALGLTLGGVVGTLSAFPLVDAITTHLTLLRWLVIIVIIFAAVAMLRSARIPSPDPAVCRWVNGRDFCEWCVLQLGPGLGIPVHPASQRPAGPRVSQKFRNSRGISNAIDCVSPTPA
jgi:hypothetical protein